MSNFSDINEFHFSPIPEFEKYVSEYELFIGKLTNDSEALSNCRLLLKGINRFAIRAAALQKKWMGTKKSTGKSPIPMIRKDLNYLLYKLHLGVNSGTNATQWGIDSAQEIIDYLPNQVPYLHSTHYYCFIAALGELFDDIVVKHKHSTIIKALRELGKHRDITTTGQYSTNEMIENYKYLSNIGVTFGRKEIAEILGIYESLCGIYEKDMVLTYYLLKLQEENFDLDYNAIRKLSIDTRKKQKIIEHVVNKMPLLKLPYERELRNAKAHVDYEIDDDNSSIIIPVERNTKIKNYSFEATLLIVKEMSALVSVYRILFIIIAKNDWMAVHKLLYPKS